SILFAMLVVSLFSCREEKEQTKIEVTGVLKNLDSLKQLFPAVFDTDSIKIFLYELPFSNDASPIQIESDLLKKDGKLSLETQATRQSIYDCDNDQGA